MGKLTWQHLGWVYEDQFGMSPKEAADILSKYLFTDTTWKGTYKNPIGRIWKDEQNINALLIVLAKLKSLEKTVGKRNARNELFYNTGTFEYFLQTTNLVYKKNHLGFKRFQNDLALWTKRVPLFSSRIKRKRKKPDPLTRKIKKQIYKYDEKIKAENIAAAEGKKRRKQLLASGEYEEVKNIYGDSSLRKVLK